jgi:hypothetical protein
LKRGINNKYVGELNVAVLATKDIFHEGVLIRYAYRHLGNGMWKFRSNMQYEADSNFMVVSLDEILDKDLSIESILNLPLGFLASRNSLHDVWSIKRLKTETNRQSLGKY